VTVRSSERGQIDDIFDVLANRYRRRLLVALLQYDEPISVDTLATHAAMGSRPSARDGAVRTGEHEAEDSRS
jgi:hypothetical protein